MPPVLKLRNVAKNTLSNCSFQGQVSFRHFTEEQSSVRMPRINGEKRQRQNSLEVNSTREKEGSLEKMSMLN